VVVAVSETFSETYAATPESVSQARHDVARYGAANGVAGERLDAVRLAVSEAVTNVVIHAYRDQVGDVHVLAAVTSGELWLFVADRGCGFQTPAATPGLGLGLALIADVSDEFEIAERAEGGTEARIRFRLRSG
jgi:anti-sigma regulatory factor (Ser/Thr protein kinase)